MPRSTKAAKDPAILANRAVISPGQVWSRYSLDGKRRQQAYLVRRVDGDMVTCEPVNSRNRVIGPRLTFSADFLTRYYLEPDRRSGGIVGVSSTDDEVAS